MSLMQYNLYKFKTNVYSHKNIFFKHMYDQKDCMILWAGSADIKLSNYIHETND